MTEPTLSDEQLYKLARDAGATCKMFGTLPDGTNRFDGIECTTAQLRSIIAADRQARQAPEGDRDGLPQLTEQEIEDVLASESDPRRLVMAVEALVISRSYSAGYNAGRDERCPLCNSPNISRVDSGDEHYEACDDCDAQATWRSPDAAPDALDARRYRWLQCNRHVLMGCAFYRTEELDAVIDAALASEPHKEQ